MPRGASSSFPGSGDVPAWTFQTRGVDWMLALVDLGSKREDRCGIVHSIEGGPRPIR